MMDLSIIIPIYNTRQSDLVRCFSSVDTLEGITYEVILVDDGSEDRVGQFCKVYVAQHPAFRYIRKENGGVSSARNLGLNHAQGKYIMFVDADDELLGGTITPELFDSNCDMIIFDALVQQGNTELVWYGFHDNAHPIDREALLYRLMTTKFLNTPWAKLYARSVIDAANIRFPADFITGEDWMFVCDCVLQAQSFLYYPQCVYRYFREEATGRFRIARFPDKMLSNQIDRYQRKRQVIDTQPWTRFFVEQVDSLAAAELIENLFNSAASLLLLKELTPERRKRICEAVEQASKKLENSSGNKTRLKLFVLLRFPIALWPLAQLRKLYLMLKH